MGKMTKKTRVPSTTTHTTTSVKHPRPLDIRIGQHQTSDGKQDGKYAILDHKHHKINWESVKTPSINRTH